MPNHPQWGHVVVQAQDLALVGFGITFILVCGILF